MSDIKTISLPIEVVDAIFNFAGRPLSRDEWKLFTEWELAIKRVIEEAQQKEPDETPDPIPLT